MAAHHVGLFMFLWIIGSVAAGDLEEIMAEPGEDVTLQCNSFTDAAITLLEWRITELGDGYVFYFRDNELMESFRNPRYRGRVELKDPQMKNGDASVVLKNVNIDDSGMYQCWVTTRSNDPNLREFVNSVVLSVSEGPEKHLKNGDANDEQPGGPGGAVGLGVSLVLVCFPVGVVVGVAVVFVVKSKRANVKRPLECFYEEEISKMNTGHYKDHFTLDKLRSPASKLNNPLRESLPCRGRGALQPL